jgi:cytochrome c oxidase cbb3-type subunit 1
MMTLLENKTKLKNDYIMWFFFSAVMFYALATFEGSLLAIRWFNMIAHNTDWIVGHVHTGSLGWVGMSAIAVFYYFIPKLWQCQQLWSTCLVKWHFWLAHIGIALYGVALWISGIGQGVMWLSLEDNGSLTNSFVAVMNFTAPWMLVRFLGGALFVLGIVLMTYNLYRTVNARDKQTLPLADGVGENA